VEKEEKVSEHASTLVVGIVQDVGVVNVNDGSARVVDREKAALKESAKEERSAIRRRRRGGVEAPRVESDDDALLWKGVPQQRPDASPLGANQ